MNRKKTKEPAKVYLVGAGPGDPAFMTLRAVEVLGLCDVVLYDRLLDKACLKYAKNATLIPVGKKPGQNGKKQQDRIIRLLIRYSYAGFTVVRLKGGDPLIFGRGGEELLALARSQVPFELVPGVSSFYAAPAMAAIPLSHRGLSDSFGVFTAHSCSETQGAWDRVINWEIAAKMPTAVFLMGLGNLSKIVSNLRKHGRQADTPIALISRASFPDQCTVVGTLANIQARAQGLRTPVTIVVGAVVDLRNEIMPQESIEQEEELEFALRGEERLA